LDAPGWQREGDAPACLPSVADAVWNEHRIRVRYQRANRVLVERDLEPLGLVLKAGIWYLVAAVADDDRGPRTYRLSRVQAAVELEQRFTRPDRFDLQRHWGAYQRDYEQRIFRATATIRLSAAGRSLLFLIGSPAARAGHAAMSEPDVEGWSTTRIPIESLHHAQHALMQLGAEVEVIEPPELRQLIATSLQAAARRYAEPGQIAR
jgi:predicted DNA-binding transcriptional regulator YafY